MWDRSSTLSPLTACDAAGPPRGGQEAVHRMNAAMMLPQSVSGSLRLSHTESCPSSRADFSAQGEPAEARPAAGACGGGREGGGRVAAAADAAVRHQRRLPPGPPHLPHGRVGRGQDHAYGRPGGPQDGCAPLLHYRCANIGKLRPPRHVSAPAPSANWHLPERVLGMLALARKTSKLCKSCVALDAMG